MPRVTSITGLVGGLLLKNVAIFGQMASGKSSIAEILTGKPGYIRIAFADPLKNISELAYGKIDKSGIYTVTDMAGNELQVSGREILQRVGQSIKAHDRDFWLRCFFNTAERFQDSPLIVDDGRFHFEAQALRDRGWLIVGLDTDESVRFERYERRYGRVPTYRELNHESEVEIPEIISTADLVLDGTYTPMYNSVRILTHAQDS